MKFNDKTFAEAQDVDIAILQDKRLQKPDLVIYGIVHDQKNKRFGIVLYSFGLAALKGYYEAKAEGYSMTIICLSAEMAMGQIHLAAHAVKTGRMRHFIGDS